RSVSVGHRPRLGRGVPGAMAGWAGEAGAAVGLLVVVVAAEPHQVVQARHVGEGPAGDVVDLEVVSGAAAGDLAAVAAGFEGGALVGGDLPPEVHHIPHPSRSSSSATTKDSPRMDRTQATSTGPTPSTAQI